MMGSFMANILTEVIALVTWWLDETIKMYFPSLVLIVAAFILWPSVRSEFTRRHEIISEGDSNSFPIT